MQLCERSTGGRFTGCMQLCKRSTGYIEVSGGSEVCMQLYGKTTYLNVYKVDLM